MPITRQRLLKESLGRDVHHRRHRLGDSRNHNRFRCHVLSDFVLTLIIALAFWPYLFITMRNRASTLYVTRTLEPRASETPCIMAHLSLL